MPIAGFKGRQQVDVKIARRLSRASLVRRAKEKVSWARDFALLPRQFVEPDPMPRHVRGSTQIENLAQGIKEVAIQAPLVQ